MMDLQDKRRRTRANEWSPYECPVGFDGILQYRDRERGDALSQQETIEDEPIVYFVCTGRLTYSQENHEQVV